MLRTRSAISKMCARIYAMCRRKRAGHRARERARRFIEVWFFRGKRRISSGCLALFLEVVELATVMADTARLEADMKDKANRDLREAKDPVEVLRLKCLSRGASGIKGLGR